VLVLEDIIGDLDMVLIMSVNPGFGGQKFIQNTYKKFNDLNKLRAQYNPQLLAEVDGGVDINNAAKLVAAGANALVAGNAVFSAPDPIKYISELKHAVPVSQA
jgi:ribulose-phosphate 3-epimerase